MDWAWDIFFFVPETCTQSLYVLLTALNPSRGLRKEREARKQERTSKAQRTFRLSMYRAELGLFGHCFPRLWTVWWPTGREGKSFSSEIGEKHVGWSSHASLLLPWEKEAFFVPRFVLPILFSSYPCLVPIDARYDDRKYGKKPCFHFVVCSTVWVLFTCTN